MFYLNSMFSPKTMLPAKMGNLEVSTSINNNKIQLEEKNGKKNILAIR